MDLILSFFLRDFVPLPSKQNIFLAPHLDFSLAKLLAIAQNFSGGDSIVFEDILLSVLFCVICFVLCTSLLRNELF